MSCLKLGIGGKLDIPHTRLEFGPRNAIGAAPHSNCNLPIDLVP
jgi:hypothetical protein